MLILPILYVILIIALLFAFFNISKNSTLQIKLLQEILSELRAKKQDHTH